jgi:MFS-type transporter involved in bile tolerance (Atg22 family)
VSLVGVVGGTVAGSRLGSRPRGGTTLARWRVLVGGTGLLLNAGFMAAALATPVAGGLALLLLLSAFSGALAIPTLTACVADVIPAADRGCGFGVLQVGATTGAALGPLAVGVISDATGSLLTGMVWLVPLLVLGGVTALASHTRVDRDAAAVLVAARH